VKYWPRRRRTPGWIMAPASGPIRATALAPATGSSTAGRAMPCSPRNDRAICDHHSIRTAGHRRLGRSPNLAAGGRWRVPARQRRGRGNRRKSKAGRQLTGRRDFTAVPRCVAFSTRSNRSSERIASASWSARPFSTGRARVRNFCAIAFASGNDPGSPEGSA